jgi:glycerophosphoryl diester phosphodiesterase
MRPGAGDATPVRPHGWDRLPFLIAHRGDSSRAPENTLASFEGALEAGAEVLECDVQLSADGVAVIVHDPTVDRTTDGAGLVRGMSWPQLRALDAGYPVRFGSAFAGQRLPRLEDLFDLARRRAQVFVEIKPEALAGGGGRVEAALVAAARRTGMEADVGVLSFAPQALVRVAALAPQMPLGLVFRWWRRRRLVPETVAAGADYLVGYAPRLLADPAIVSGAHAAGLRVGAYVADSVEVMAGLLRIGVDGIATNRVGDLLPAFQEMTS